MNKLSKSQSSYLAGFLDADGSIYVKLTKNSTYKYRYQVSPNIVFYQSQSSKVSLKELHKITGIGYLRKRNDGIEEYIIGDIKSIRDFLNKIEKFLIFKRKQAFLI
ncbi:MAG: LAGLIDADG homing endonuclease [Candidatus Daviesbacteria bacterium GW2011_GWB1_36_5]|uniref:LAGLIDADG homing endonuclease n=1 Tax=Candidatus Daviesbacteria bacterium GW2011_GWB1_36_5 TaxID=1618426 RepID=A0A0G0F8L5_9BACT|nr:MAG: LAGLIDADG homing endonuclease [Candidatus Daviesbacteria bacterium GW2011_GWB1_36_5]